MPSIVFPKDRPANSQESNGLINSKARRRELAWFGVILLAGLLPRLVFITLYPTKPVSDFSNILIFALQFRDDLFARGSVNWLYFNPGAPLLLSIFFKLIPASFVTVTGVATAVMAARVTTASMMGLLPILPFTLWKDIFSLRVRVITALMLALWPGQIIFSGVLAQDNWVLLPVVGLGVLTVRVLALKSGGYPFLASILYFSGIAIRQDMMIVLLPLLIVLVIGCKPDRRVRNAIIGAVTTTLLLSLLMIQRGIGSGRYALSTSHLDVSILGSYVPGAWMGWADPKPYIAATAPELFENDQYKEEALHLVWQEVRRRPKFHAIRIFSSPLYNLFQIEPGLAFWSLTAAGVLPADIQEKAYLFSNRFVPTLQHLSYVIHAIFIASVLFSLFRRQIFILILPLMAVIVLKLGIHAVIASQPRYFLPVIDLELLVIGIVSSEMLARRYLKVASISLLIGSVGIITLLYLTTRGEQYIRNNDENFQRTYQFPLLAVNMNFQCVMTDGRLLSFLQTKADKWGEIMIDFLKEDPPSGSKAIVECRTIYNQISPFRIYIHDPYPFGGLPDRVMQIVYINGVEVYQHDIAAEPGEGWHELSLGNLEDGSSLTIKVELHALKPDAGWAWGRAAATRIFIGPVSPQ